MAARSTPNPDPDPAQATRTHPRVLVAEDDPGLLRHLELVLRTQGYSVRTARNGLQAIDVADQFHPEIVLLDIGLPELNGYAAAEHIRQQPWGKHAILIATTGWSDEHAIHRSKVAGFDHHLTKPIDSVVLLSLLATLRPL